MYFTIGFKKHNNFVNATTTVYFEISIFISISNSSLWSAVKWVSQKEYVWPSHFLFFGTTFIDLKLSGMYYCDCVTVLPNFKLTANDLLNFCNDMLKHSNIIEPEAKLRRTYLWLEENEACSSWCSLCNVYISWQLLAPPFTSSFVLMN